MIPLQLDFVHGYIKDNIFYLTKLKNKEKYAVFTAQSLKDEIELMYSNMYRTHSICYDVDDISPREIIKISREYDKISSLLEPEEEGAIITPREMLSDQLLDTYISYSHIFRFNEDQRYFEALEDEIRVRLKFGSLNLTR